MTHPPEFIYTPQSNENKKYINKPLEKKSIFLTSLNLFSLLLLLTLFRGRRTTHRYTLLLLFIEILFTVHFALKTVVRS